MIGQSIANYEIIQKLGEGGMGVVYKARDKKLDRTVALKFLPASGTTSEEDKQRFTREAKAAAALNHPNICTIHSVDEHNGEQFIVMEHIEGNTLRAKQETGSWNLETVIDYALQIADALQHAHSKDIVHRDIKPENIMVTDGNRIKVMDFGLAKLRGTQNLTKSHSTVGTLGYMSPEQIQGGDVDHRSDIFSFGVVLYELLTRQRPFWGEHEAAIVYSIVNEEPPPIQTYLPDPPPGLIHVLNRSLEKDPADRYQAIDDMLIDLRTLKKGSVQTSTSGIRGSHNKSYTRKSGTAALSLQKSSALIGVLIVTVIVVWFVFFSPSNETVTITPERKMLVVLPFENLGDSEMDYFVDGISDEITSSLATLSGLGVIGRSSAMRYKNTTKTVQEIADELGVEYIMEGTVRWEQRHDGEILVRVNPQLIRVSDATQVWAHSFDAVLSGILALQSDIAKQVANALNVTLLASERRALDTERKVNPAAYDYYLRGVQYFRRGYAEPDYRIAVDFYKKAIELDSLFPSAYAKLSRAYSNLYWFHYDRSEEILRQSEFNARRAIELAPNLADGYEALGWYYYHGLLDYDRALRQFSRALSLQPQIPDVIYGIAAVRRRQGKFEESIRHFEAALILSPTDPVLLSDTGQAYRLIREYESALNCFERSIKFAPDLIDAYNFKAIILLQIDGNLRRAKRVFQEMKEKGVYRLTDTVYRNMLVYFPLYERNYQKILALLDANPGYILSTQFEYIPGDLYKALAYYYAGDHDNARQFFASANRSLNPMLDDYPQDPRLHIAIGTALAGLGKHQEAIRHGERAVEILPFSHEAYRGAYVLEGLARIYAMTGRHGDAIDALHTLLTRPSHVNHVILRLDPAWDPLRNEPRFQKLISEKS